MTERLSESLLIELYNYIMKTKPLYALCDICTSATYNHYFDRDDGQTVVKCKNCGFCYLNPKPDQQYLDSIYMKRSYFKNDTTTIGYSDYFSYQQENMFWQIMKKKILKLSKLKISTCLDIGCASGDFLQLMTREGAIGYGVELSPHAAKLARNKNLVIYNKKFEDIHFQDHFELITLFDVIEHVESPTLFMKKVYSLLNPDGLVVITTPNLKKFNLDGSQWLGFTSSHEHLYFFTPETIKRLLAQSGFILLKIETYDDYCYPALITRYIKKLPTKYYLRGITRRLFIPFNSLLNKLNFGHTMIVYATKK